MRIVIVGQQAFGKAVLDAFLARGDTVAGVFAAPERPGARPDPLVAAAQERGLTVHRHAKYSSDEAKQALAELNAEIGVMAYVLLFAPPEFCAIPKHGMIQFHPSLLPLHRGPSSIPWAIIRGRTETGLSIFRPTPGLDEGPVILQKRMPIGPDDTAGSLYFDKIFPLGVEALVQAADLIVSGRATETGPTPAAQATGAFPGVVATPASEIPARIPLPPPAMPPSPPRPVVPPLGHPAIVICGPLVLVPTIRGGVLSVCGSGFHPAELVTLTLIGRLGRISWSAVAGADGTFRSPVPPASCRLVALSVVARGSRGSVASTTAPALTFCRM